MKIWRGGFSSCVSFARAVPRSCVCEESSRGVGDQELGGSAGGSWEWGCTGVDEEGLVVGGVWPSVVKSQPGDTSWLFYEPHRCARYHFHSTHLQGFISLADV